MIRLTMKSMLAMLHVFCQHYYYFARSLLCKWGKRDFAAFFLPKNWCILYKEHQLPLTHSHFIAQSGITKLFAAYIIAFHHCKPKPCKAYREFPVSQFSQGKPCFHYREPCSHCRDPVSITGIFLKNPVLPCMGLHCCKTGPCQVFPSPTFSLEKPALTTGKILFFVN